MPNFLATARFRIALWNACGVAGIALLALLVVRQGVWWTMLQEIDNVLADDVQEIELALHELSTADFAQLTAELRRKAAGHSEHGWFVVLRDSAREVRWQSAEPPVNLAALTHSRSAPSRSLGDTRLLLRPIGKNPHRITEALVGTSISTIRADIARIDRLVLAAGGAILLLSPAFGYVLAGRATKDVQEMSATAERLKPAALDERLAIRGTGDEFDRLAYTINELLDRIALYISQKRDFLADAAHELRTPLAAIHSSIEVALTRPRTPDEYRRLLEDVMEEGEALETLVNQLLLMSEVAARPHTREAAEVDLSEVVTKSVDMFSGVAEANDIFLRTEVARGVHITGQKNHLRQLLNNLVDNAIKYAPPRTEVLVRLGFNSADKVIVLTVADQGRGIPTRDIPQLFDRFFRVDRSRSRAGKQGSGLGLAICKSIAEAHGGTITCASTEGLGTTMTVIFPHVAAWSVADGQHVIHQ